MKRRKIERLRARIEGGKMSPRWVSSFGRI